MSTQNTTKFNSVKFHGIPTPHRHLFNTLTPSLKSSSTNFFSLTHLLILFFLTLLPFNIYAATKGVCIQNVSSKTLSTTIADLKHQEIDHYKISNMGQYTKIPPNSNWRNYCIKCAANLLKTCDVIVDVYNGSTNTFLFTFEWSNPLTEWPSASITRPLTDSTLSLQIFYPGGQGDGEDTVIIVRDNIQ